MIDGLRRRMGAIPSVEAGKSGSIDSGVDSARADPAEKPSDSFNSSDATTGSVSTTNASAKSGFQALLQPLQALPTRTKLAIVTGILALAPPFYGVVARWNDPPTPVAFETSRQRARELGEPTQLLAKLTRANGSKESPINTEESCREMVRLFYVEGEERVFLLSQLIGATQGHIDQMRDKQPWDAKLGKRVDWWWGGIAPESRPFHEGNAAQNAFKEQRDRWDLAEPSIRGFIRDAIAEMMGKSDPQFKRNYESLRHLRVLATQLQEFEKQATEASDKLKKAAAAWDDFERTPREVDKQVEETQRKDGKEVTVRVSKKVANPEYEDRERDAKSATDDAEKAVQKLAVSSQVFVRAGLSPSLEVTNTSVDQHTIARRSNELSELYKRHAYHTRKKKDRIDGLERELEPKIGATWERLKPPGAANERVASASSTARAEPTDW